MSSPASQPSSSSSRHDSDHQDRIAEIAEPLAAPLQDPIYTSRLRAAVGPGMMFEVYEDSRKEWRWSLVAANGRTLSYSGEGYKNWTDMMTMIDAIRRGDPIPVVHFEP